MVRSRREGDNKMKNNPYRKCREKLRKLVGLQVMVVDDERAESIAHGKLEYITQEQTRRTQKNPGFYVAGIHIPIFSVRTVIVDNVIDIDKSYLVRRVAA